MKIKLAAIGDPVERVLTGGAKRDLLRLAEPRSGLPRSEVPRSEVLWVHADGSGLHGGDYRPLPGGAGDVFRLQHS